MDKLLLFLLVLAISFAHSTDAFTVSRRRSSMLTMIVPIHQHEQQQYVGTSLRMSDETESIISKESDQLLLGAAGTLAAIITLYSEFTLKTTGCGLPAGPFGLVGATEGVSYLGIVGLAGLSLYSKLKTGSGLPAGPYALLGAAEGLSFLAIVAGLVVFGFQIMDYGYIPNAVPMEGGMCS